MNQTTSALKEPRRVRPGSPLPDGAKSELPHGPPSVRKHGAAARAVEDKPAKAAAEPYQPTAYERSLTAAYLARRKAEPPAPRMRVSEKDGVTTLEPDHPKASIAQIRLLEALGSNDFDFRCSSNCATWALKGAQWTRKGLTSCSP